MPHILSIVELVSALIAILLVAAVVLAVCKKIRIPFTVALVVVGMIIAHAGNYVPTEFAHYFTYKISPDLIFYVCLPTLLFESALSINPRQLRRNLTPILALAIPGLLISTTLIGLIVSSLTHISLASSLLLGAILSATDPIAVIALFKQLGAPKRLTVLIEGESLFNDATSIVTAKLLFTVVIAGMVTSHDISHGVLDFFIEFFGGIVVGWAIALIVGFVLGLVESDPEIEISLTTILAYATFIIGQDVFHVSGVMATVAAGLTLGGWGRAKISPSVHEYLHHFWEFLAYIANALIFLLVGLSVDLWAMWSALGILGVVLIAMFVSRAVITFGLIPALSKIPGSVAVSRGYQIAIYWGGLRGAIALAIVLSLPEFEYKQLFVALVMGAVLFTLIVNGLTMEKLVSWLGLDVPPLADRLAKAEGQLSAANHALERIPELQRGGLFSARIAGTLQQNWQKRLKLTEQRIEALRAEELNDVEEEKLLYLRALAAEKNLYYQMFAKGHLSERAYRNLNELIVVQTDVLRYSDSTDALQKIPPKVQRKRRIIKLLEKIPLLDRIAENMRAVQVARNYEEYWGQYQGYLATLTYLDKVIKEQPGKSIIAKKVRDYFQAHKEKTGEQLDLITEQFPEFVTAMQERLANRLVLQAEHDALEEQAKTGTLPREVAHSMQKAIVAKLYKLREKPSTKIELDPNELLRKIPFFKDIPSEEFAEIQKLLHPKMTSSGEDIITEGETGDSLFLIMRGVVRVSKIIEGKERDLATLFAGDFFGEVALLHSEPRNATCRAVTPCSLFELKRSDFQVVASKYPVIQAAIEKADAERRGK